MDSSDWKAEQRNGWLRCAVCAERSKQLRRWVASPIHQLDPSCVQPHFRLPLEHPCHDRHKHRDSNERRTPPDRQRRESCQRRNQ